jgi:CheY-like chemotaxis protein
MTSLHILLRFPSIMEQEKKIIGLNIKEGNLMKRLNCILVIDDDKVSNYITENVIRGMGAAVNISSVTDGKKGLDFLKYQCKGDDNFYCPDLILLDINMPFMDGREFLKNLYQINNNIQVVILSTLEPGEKEKEELMSLNVIDFKVKPLTAEKLTSILEKHFHLAHP